MAKTTIAAVKSKFETGDKPIGQDFIDLIDTLEDASLMADHQTAFAHSDIAHANRAALDLVAGANTGDETTATIKTKLGVTTLSGSNTGDQDLSSYATKAELSNITVTGGETAATIKAKLGITTLSGANTGDETDVSIKSKLGISTLSGANTGDQDLTGYATKTGAETLTNKTLTAPKGTKVALPANDINVTSGDIFTKTITGATTFTVSNVPAAGTSIAFMLELTNGGVATITWWGGVKWAGGTAPALTAAGVDLLGFTTHDGGVTWFGMLLSKDSK